MLCTVFFAQNIYNSMQNLEDEALQNLVNESVRQSFQIRSLAQELWPTIGEFRPFHAMSFLKLNDKFHSLLIFLAYFMLMSPTIHLLILEQRGFVRELNART